MHEIKISIIIPVYNVEDYLEECLACIKKQTFDEYEVICVDDGSTDGSSEILQKYAECDSRYVLLTQTNKGAGAARNAGFAAAKGEYVIFLDGDDLFSPKLLEKTYTVAVGFQADIVAFNFSDTDGITKWRRKGIHSEWLPDNKKVFNYKDCPDRIMSIINPVPWNKLYQKKFILDNNLRYEEIACANDITFAAVSAACAVRITYIEDPLIEHRIGHSGTVSSMKSKKPDNVVLAVNSAVAQARSLSYSSEIASSIIRFAIEQYIFVFKKYIATNFNDSNAKRYYEYIHQYFLREEFSGITPESLHNEQLFWDFCIIKENNYQTMQMHLSRKMIVSMTSYPARINNLSLVLNSIFSQSHKPDEVVLWLADDEFPNLEEDLPDFIKQLSAEKKLSVRWCDNLKPHNKYFYALQEYTDALVITVDDDIIYSPHLLEKLFDSYLLFPNAVSAARAHLIITSEENEILPYDDWIKEADGCLHIPSMQLFATGVGGVLYPPGVMQAELFNKEVIKRTCLLADDLWLKAMEVLLGVPVVVACPFEGLSYVPGSQDKALYKQNVNLQQNDIQFSQINEWLDIQYGKDILKNKLLAFDNGEKFFGIRGLSRYFRNERKTLQKKWRTIQQRLQTAYEDKSEISAKLQRTYQEKSEINAKLKQTYEEKSEINAKLKQTYEEKSAINAKFQRVCQEKTEINAKLKQAYEEKSEINEKLQKTYEEKSTINAKFQRTCQEKTEINARLKQAYEEKSEINAKLKQTYEEKSEINAKLKRAYEEKSEINGKLQQTYKEKSERGIQIKKLTSELKTLQEENERLRDYIEQQENKKLSTKAKKIYHAILGDYKH